ncbi:MAG: FkbM family methyltransferase [Candidatus Poribacteria bacterium]|nr:FkbM family methyltransferase [Candidatus Poribacteria bacterium]
MRYGVPIRMTLNAVRGGAEIVYELHPTKFTHLAMKQQMRRHGFYEPSTSRLLLRLLREGDTFVDIGAHFGYYTLIASRVVGNRGRVLAVEGDGDNIAHLRRHIELNGAENVEVVHRILDADKRTREFWTNPDNDGGHALWDIGECSVNVRSRRNPQPKSVETETLDATLDAHRIDHIQLLKIDTEGAEHAILQGATVALARGDIRFVIVEINEFALERMGSSQMALRAFAAERGYATYFPAQDGSEPTFLPDDKRIEPPDELFAFNVLFARPDDIAAYWGNSSNG